MEAICHLLVRLYRSLVTAFIAVPFIGGLHETSPKDRAEAAGELALGQIVATMPIWVGTIFVAWPQFSLQSIASGFQEMIQNGELFIYAAGTVAPVLYIVSKERNIPKAFPNKYWYLGLVWVGTIIAAIVFILQRTRPQPIGDSAINASIWFYVGALLLLYFAFVYNNALWPDPAAKMRDDENEYVERVRRHRD